MASIEPIPVTEFPRSVVQDNTSDAGQLQSSVQKWAKEVSLAMRNMNSTVQNLKTAAASTPTASTTTTTPAGAAASVSETIQAAGLNGWSPVFALINYSGAVILKLVSWAGGTGNPPASGLYVGPAGFVSNPGAATNLIGPAASSGGITAQMVFSATSTSAPPPAGGVIFDNSTFASIANVYVSNVDRNGINVSSVLGQIGVGSLINVFQQSPSLAYTFATFIVTAAVVHSGYYQFTVSPLSGQVLPDVQPVGFSFTGSAGTGNVTGAASSTNGDFALFSGTSGKVLKDTGVSAASFDSAGAAAAAQAAAIAASDPAGSATAALALALLKANNLSDLSSSAAARLNLANNQQATGITGAYTINFAGQENLSLTLSGATTFASSGLVFGRKILLNLLNPTGGAIALTWPAWFSGGPATIPASIPATTTLQIRIYALSTTDASVMYYYVAPATGGGNVSGPGTTVSGNVALWNNITGTLLKDGGTLGTAAFAATGAFDAAGAATAAQAAAIAASVQRSWITGIFNVRAYGALGDGTTDDTASIGPGAGSAINALVAYSSLNSSGTLYFPSGTYKVSAALAIAITTSPRKFTIKGDGQFSSVIYQTASAVDGITVTLPLNGSSQAMSSVEVFDLGFETNTTPACALRVTYGATSSGSAEAGPWVAIHDINIQSSTNQVVSQGFNNGIYLNGIWKCMVDRIHGCGGANGSAAVITNGTLPTTGGSVGGGGALITVYGGQNCTIANIYGSYWQWGIYFGNGSSGQGMGTCNMTNVILVAVYRGFQNASGTNISNFNFCNWLIDQGNLTPNAGLANVAIWIEGGTGLSANNHMMTNVSFTMVAGTSSSYGVYLNNVVKGSFNITIYAAPTGGGVYLAGASNYNMFQGGTYASGLFTIAGTSDYNAVNNTQTVNASALTITSSGTHNIQKTTLF